MPQGGRLDAGWSVNPAQVGGAEKFYLSFTRGILLGLAVHLSPLKSKLNKCHFQLGSEPLWAWVCAVLDRQDAFKELFKCVLVLIG